MLIERNEQSSLYVIRSFDTAHIRSFTEQIQESADGPALATVEDGGGISLSVGLVTGLAALWVLRPVFPSFGSVL